MLVVDHASCEPAIATGLDLGQAIVHREPGNLSCGGETKRCASLPKQGALSKQRQPSKLFFFKKNPRKNNSIALSFQKQTTQTKKNEIKKDKKTKTNLEPQATALAETPSSRGIQRQSKERGIGLRCLQGGGNLMHLTM